jgi:hypothetical protein
MFHHCFTSVTAITLVAGSVFVSPAWAAEKVASPAYESWARFKPGTTVTLKQSMRMAAMSMDSEMHHELKEVTPDKVTIQSWTIANMMGMKRESPRQTITLPAMVDKGSEEMPAGYNGKVEVVGDEKVTVGGKEYDCKVVHFSGTQEGMKSDGKIWASDSVPGRTVKMEMKVTGDTEMIMNSEIADVNVKE